MAKELKESKDTKPKKTAKAASSKEKKPVVNKKLLGFEYKIIRAPHITEKATHAEEHHVYVFKVSQDASKGQIKVAIQNVFGVRVTKVRTSQVKPKVKRRGLTSGTTKSWKKAYVSVHKDDTLKLV